MKTVFIISFLLNITLCTLNASEAGREPWNVEQIISVGFKFQNQEELAVFVSKNADAIVSEEELTATLRFPQGKMKGDILKDFPEGLGNAQVIWTCGICSVNFMFNSEEALEKFEKLLNSGDISGKALYKSLGIYKFHAYPKMQFLTVVYKEKYSLKTVVESINKFLIAHRVLDVSYRLFTH